MRPWLRLQLLPQSVELFRKRHAIVLDIRRTNIASRRQNVTMFPDLSQRRGFAG
jgi:hypothetical protein